MIPESELKTPSSVCTATRKLLHGSSANLRLSRNRLMGSVGSVLTFVADAAPGLAHDIIINRECGLILR